MEVTTVISSAEVYLFLLVVVAPFFLIGGLGAAIAFSLYNLDRMHRGLH